MSSFPEGLLGAWYGDDFTGAAAVMEVLAIAGVPAMLVLDVPTPEQLAGYPDLRAVGVASTARAWSPERMARDLPSAFAAPQIRRFQVFATSLRAWATRSTDWIEATFWSEEDIQTDRSPIRPTRLGKIPVVTIDSRDAKGEAAAG